MFSSYLVLLLIKFTLYIWFSSPGSKSKGCHSHGRGCERRYEVCDCKGKSKSEVSPSGCRCNRVASCKNDRIVVYLDEDGALGLGGRWWGSRADSRVEDAKVDEPGTWDHVC